MRKNIFIFLTLSLLVACGSSDSVDQNLDSDFDGIPDISDSLPQDTDNDEIPNAEDSDDDNDGYSDDADAFPYNPSEWHDTDGDGEGNNADSDDDNDNVEDGADVFSLNRDESADNDGDGVGDNGDLDDDGDGIPDSSDSMPFDSSVSGDIDEDGTDNLKDNDDDGDGYKDSIEAAEGANPLDSKSMPQDADSDGLTDREEKDVYGTDSSKPDTDADELTDFYEIQIGSNPNLADTDEDSINDFYEIGDDFESPADYDSDGMFDISDSQFLVEFKNIPAVPETSLDRYGCAIDEDAKIVYLTDPSGDAIYTFSFDGEWLGVMDDPAHPLDSPNDVAMGTNGNLFILDTDNNQIKVYTNGGDYIASIGVSEGGPELGKFNHPRGFFVNDKNIYVADTLNHRIQILDLNGAHPRSFGGEGSDFGYLNFPNEVVVGKTGDIYVADTFNNRVQIFSDKWEFLRQVDAASVGRATFQFIPRGVALDGSGNLYVADEFSHSIIVFNSDGNLVIEIGGYGDGIGEFMFPSSICMRSDHKIFVADQFRMQSF